MRKHKKHHRKWHHGMTKAHLKVRGHTRVVYIAKHQHGRTHIHADRMRKALKPGKRVTAWGTVYYETRANRSDKNRKRRL